MNNKDIVFNVNQDNKPALEKLTKESLQDSLFAKQYQYALQQIDYYVASLSQREHDKENSHGIDNNNNIFAFLGDRGTGKTSCMISLSELLISGEISKFAEYQSISKRTFVGLDLIDPSYFDDNNNVVSLFLAKLYHKFCELKKDKKSYYTDGEDYKENIEQQFLRRLSETQKHLMYMLSDEGHDKDDTLENLGWLSASVDLRDDIRKLVDAYLKVAINDREDSILVIEIDDIDLNTRQASKMAELVRKYFIQPNVIVLMSLNLQQFIYAKINDVSADFEAGVEELTSLDLHDIAEKYVNKFIPQSQRIYMPATESFTHRSLSIESENGSSRKYLSIRQAVPELIFIKSRYLYYNNSLSDSPIIPRNLRDLRQLIKLMYLLPDYDKENVESTIYNKNVFKDYLLRTWAGENVSHKEQQFAQTVMDARDFSQVNRYMWEALSYTFGSNDYPFDRPNYMPNINGILTTGDIVSTITMLEQKVRNEGSLKYIFLLKSIYSIKLYEAYDSITEGNTFDDSREHALNEIYRSDLSNDMDDYTRLTYGVMFNTTITPLLKSEQNNVDFNQRVVEKNEFLRLFNKCFAYIELFKNLSDADLKDFSSSLKLLEVLMLGIRIAPGDDDYVNMYQSVNNSYTLRFEIGCFFYNLMHVFDNDWACYRRFDSLGAKAQRVISFIKENRNLSYKLWPSFVLRTLTRDEDKNTALTEEDYKTYRDKILDLQNNNSWLSLCAFRNVEIMQDFLHYFNSIKYNPNDCADSYRIFFERMGSYGINTYDKTSDGESDYHRIRFRYGLDIATIFYNPKVSKEFNKILMSENLDNIQDQSMQTSSSSGATQ